MKSVSLATPMTYNELAEACAKWQRRSLKLHHALFALTKEAQEFARIIPPYANSEALQKAINVLEESP